MGKLPPPVLLPLSLAGVERTGRDFIRTLERAGRNMVIHGVHGGFLSDASSRCVAISPQATDEVLRSYPGLRDMVTIVTVMWDTIWKLDPIHKEVALSLRRGEGGSIGQTCEKFRVFRR